MAIIVPNTASTLGSSGSIPNAADKWAWIGFQTLTASGCCVWYRSSASTSGSELMAISLSPQQSVLYGPFNSPNGLTVVGISGGCALIMLKVP